MSDGDDDAHRRRRRQTSRVAAEAVLIALTSTTLTLTVVVAVRVTTNPAAGSAPLLPWWAATVVMLAALSWGGSRAGLSWPRRMVALVVVLAISLAGFILLGELRAGQLITEVKDVVVGG